MWSSTLSRYDLGGCDVSEGAVVCHRSESTGALVWRQRSSRSVQPSPFTFRQRFSAAATPRPYRPSRPSERDDLSRVPLRSAY